MRSLAPTIDLSNRRTIGTREGQLLLTDSLAIGAILPRILRIKTAGHRKAILPSGTGCEWPTTPAKGEAPASETNDEVPSSGNEGPRR